MKLGEPYIRKKGNKYILEIKADSKTIFLKTLPNVSELLELLTQEASQSYIEKKVQEAFKASPNIERPD